MNGSDGEIKISEDTVLEIICNLSDCVSLEKTKIEKLYEQIPGDILSKNNELKESLDNMLEYESSFLDVVRRSVEKYKCCSDDVYDTMRRLCIRGMTG